jgi:Reverse transcriptase (RNA-dependent DNA polymerase)
MDAKMDQLKALGTYTAVELPSDQVPIPCKWVYCIKHDHEGNIICHKGCLVAKGFSQIPGIDFTETFAPDMLWLLLALAALWGLAAHVVNIVGTYLNGDLKEEIYMQQPPEYNDGAGRVWKLIKTLYGLWQSGRVWNDKLNQAFLQLGFKRLIADQCETSTSGTKIKIL